MLPIFMSNFNSLHKMLPTFNFLMSNVTNLNFLMSNVTNFQCHCVKYYQADSLVSSLAIPAMISKIQMKPMPMNNLVYVKNLGQDHMIVKNADFNMALICST